MKSITYLAKFRIEGKLRRTPKGFERVRSSDTYIRDVVFPPSEVEQASGFILKDLQHIRTTLTGLPKENVKSITLHLAVAPSVKNDACLFVLPVSLLRRLAALGVQLEMYAENE